ncbi:MAG TPA: Sec-independent protein translocase protein TatB [Caulobacteraceae bacterium]|nr:Sec-independent protein translocase protein TatB [Caulobacteraceae bacterium]
MFPEGRLLEFIIVGAVALIVVGPKDLPILMRKVGQFIGRMRAMAAEFRASFDELARQSELDELRKEVEALRNAQPMQAAADAAGHAEVEATLDEIHAGLSETGMQLHPPMGYQYPTSLEPVEPPAVVEKAAKPARKRRAPAARKAPSGKTSARKTSTRKTKSDEIVR